MLNCADDSTQSLLSALIESPVDRTSFEISGMQNNFEPFFPMEPIKIGQTKFVSDLLDQLEVELDFYGE